MIRALIVLECVLLIIVALDRVVGVPASGVTSGVTIERAARERDIGRDMSTNVQDGLMRTAIAPAAAVARPGFPQSVTLDETAHAMARTKPAESSIVSRAASPTTLPAATSR